MNFSVKGDRIFVILDEFKTTKEITLEDGRTMTINLPDKHSERSRVGTIVALGKDIVNGWNIGDRVLLSTYAGTRVHLIGAEAFGQEIDEDRFRVIREEEIVAQVHD